MSSTSPTRTTTYLCPFVLGRHHPINYDRHLALRETFQVDGHQEQEIVLQPSQIVSLRWFSVGRRREEDVARRERGKQRICYDFVFFFLSFFEVCSLLFMQTSFNQRELIIGRSPGSRSEQGSL